MSQIIARLFRTLDTYLISFRKGHKKQAFHCIEYFQVIISFHQINCLDVHCDNPLSLSFTKSSQDMFTESQYAAQIGNISGKSQCEDFRMDATFRSYPPTNEVGICPWTFGKNVDNDRVPRELWEAKCACRCGLRRTDCLQYRCVPVYTYVTVLRRKNCTNVTQEIFPLSVGCTQVRLIRRLDANQMIPWNVKKTHRKLFHCINTYCDNSLMTITIGLLYKCIFIFHDIYWLSGFSYLMYLDKRIYDVFSFDAVLNVYIFQLLHTM